jgi:transglutaminase-like putative cysteine protease
MLFQVTHTTRYTYEGPVTQCLNQVRLTPRSLPLQQVRDVGLSVHPAPVSFHRWKDYFGNDVTTFAVFERHDLFVATASSIVETQPNNWLADGALMWESARDRLAAAPDDECLRASEFLFNSPYVPTSPELAEYARTTFPPGRPLVESLKELSHRIHTEFKYAPQSTSIDMPLIDVLRNRHGVCQDFAHVMIGALRSLHLAARYVSGYVRTNGQYKGAQASHAWVSVFVPGSGWLDFDPTNDLMPSDNHVTLAWGRDYGDVTPVKGVALGGGEQLVAVEVHVSEVVDG